MKNNKEYILSFSLILLIIIFLFRKFIFGEYVFVSADTLSPQAIKHSINNSIGSFPLWFSYIFSGMPTIHSLLNINNYYLPHHLFSFLNDLGMPWIWNFLFHYIFSAMGMFSLLRFLKQSRIASFLAAFLYSLSPYMIAYLAHGHGSQIMTAAYIPWVILFLFRIHNKNNIKDYCILSIFIGLQLLRGHIQIVYYTWMMIGLYTIISICYNVSSKKGNLKKYFYNQFVILSSILIGFLTSLSVYLPILNYSKLSTRGSDIGGIGIDKATQWSLNINEIATFILPHAYGFGGKGYWGYLPFTDFPNYLGVIVLLFALLGIFHSEIKKEYKIFFIATAILSFLISLGHNFISFYKIFYNYLPFFNKFRVPIFILILFQFSIYIFTAIGLNKLPEIIKNKFQRNVITSIILVIICSYALFSFKKPQLFRYEQYRIDNSEIFNSIKQEYIKAFENFDINNDGISNQEDSKIFKSWIDHEYKILVSHLKFSQYQNTNYYNITTLKKILKETNSEVNLQINNVKFDYYFIIISLILLLLLLYVYSKYAITKKYFLFLVSLLLISDYLRVNDEIINATRHIPNKQIVHNKLYLEKYLLEDEVIKFLNNDKNKYRILDRTGNFNKNRWAAFNIETIDGYHPAKISLYDRLLRKIDNQNGGVFHSGLLYQLNIKYIIHNKMGVISDFNILENSLNNNLNEFQMSFFNNNNAVDRDVYIYKNKNFLDRIFVTKNIEFFDNDSVILDKIISQDFNPIELSFINKNDLRLDQIKAIKQIRYDKDTKIELIDWSSDKIKFTYDSNSPQIIILSEIFHPGWKILNSEIEVIRINGLFRAIIIPEGKKDIIMQYKPIDLIVGKWISIFSYMVIIFLAFVSYRRKNV